MYKSVNYRDEDHFVDGASSIDFRGRSDDASVSISFERLQFFPKGRVSNLNFFLQTTMIFLRICGCYCTVLLTYGMFVDW